MSLHRPAPSARRVRCRPAVRRVVICGLLVVAAGCSSAGSTPTTGTDGPDPSVVVEDPIVQVRSTNFTCGPTDAPWLALDVRTMRDMRVVVELTVGGTAPQRSETFDIVAQQDNRIGVYPAAGSEGKEGNFKVIEIPGPDSSGAEQVMASGTAPLTFTGGSDTPGRCG